MYKCYYFGFCFLSKIIFVHRKLQTSDMYAAFALIIIRLFYLFK